MFLTDIRAGGWFVVFVTAVTGAAAVTHSNGSINTIYGIILTLNIYIAIYTYIYIFGTHVTNVTCEKSYTIPTYPTPTPTPTLYLPVLRPRRTISTS